MEKRTPLYEKHLAAGGKMVPFAGYLLPVQYSGVIAEHRAVRTAAGLFDVSHMGELFIEGPSAFQALQQLLTNDLAGMQTGDCRYSPMCNETGGVVDDLIVYKGSDELWLLVVNAANKNKDAAWISAHLPLGAQLSDNTDNIAQLAVQGPKSHNVLAKLANSAELPQEYYSFRYPVNVAGISSYVSRTGYTGEDGYELYCEAADAPALWDALVEAGSEEGLVPCGLGARDTLRLEAGMPLYGHEMDETITPQEAGLGFFVKMDKPDFIGKAALAAKGKPTRRRTGLRITGRGIAREHCPVYLGAQQVGMVTSGTQLPYLGWAGAMALLDTNHRDIGTVLEVDVRGRRVEAEVIKLPFYKRQY